MKIAMKLYLLITPLVFIPLYGAEKPTTQEYRNPRFEEVAARIAKLDPQDEEGFRKLQREINKKTIIEIQNKEVEFCAAFRQHNQNPEQVLQKQDPK